MSFSAYDEYKDSGIEWVGKVPLHWETMKLGRVTLDRCDGPFGSGLKSSHYVDDGIRVIRLNNIRHNHLDESDAAFIDPVHYHEELGGGHDVVAGDLLIAGLGDDNNAVGRACVAPDGIEPAMVKADCFRYRLDQDRVLPSFMSAQLTVGAPTDAGLLSTGTTRSRMPLSVTSSRRVALPPLDEQKAISSFLDVETSKIDGLVSEQRRLIELLKEKRQAVISHAVTKGLNPNAPMKPSGIQWLGDVPQHWRHGVKLKTLAINAPASFTNGPFGSDLLTSELQDEGVPVIYIRDLKVEGYKRKSSSHVTPEKAEQLNKFHVDPEDVLIAKVGDPPGFCCTYPIGEPPAIICQDVIRLKPDSPLISPYFLCFLLNSEPGKESIDSVCVELTRKRFSLADLQSLRFSIPPRDEQDEIVAELDRRLGKLDSLLGEAERAIELLQERRTALISAAVTGKIDVREFTYQETV